MSSSEILIDLGSGSIGAAVVTRDAHGKPLIESVKRVPIGDGSEVARNKIGERAGEALKSLFSEYAREGKVKKVHVVLAAPWYEAKVRSIVSQSSKRPVKVTRSTVGRTVREYEKANPSGVAEGRRQIESVVTQVYVNGYPTAIKHTVYGLSMKVNVYQSWADAAFLEKLRIGIIAVLPGAKIFFHTFPLTAFTVMRAERDESGFVIADVGGEITDVIVSDRDSLKYLSSFPIGSQNIARAIAAAKASGTNEDAFARLSLLARGELTLSEMGEFKKAFDEAVKGWVAEFMKIEEAVVIETPFPQTVFITADRGELEWLPMLFNAQMFGVPVRVIPVAHDFFHGGVDLGEGGQFDSFLSLEALYLGLPSAELIEVP